MNPAPSPNDEPKNTSFVPGCVACVAGTLDTPEDWQNHPFAGHGFTREWGWTHPDLKNLLP